MMGLLSLFFIFIKLGVFSFGGGYGMLPLLASELQQNGLMSAEKFADLASVSQLTPGPIATSAAGYIGYERYGALGIIVTSIAISIPAICITLTVNHFMNKFKESKLMNSILGGIRPAAVGMVATAVIYFGKTSVVNTNKLDKIFSSPLSTISLSGIFIFIMTIFLNEKLKVSPIIITFSAAIVGAFIM